LSDHDSVSLKTIIFDFDFTLADSSIPIVECVNYGLRGLGLPEASSDEIGRTIGLHLSEALVVLAGEEQQPNADKFLALFGDRADQIMADNTVIFPKVPEALDDLKNRGYTMGIVSTKYRYRIEDILGRAGLLRYFDNIVGGEDVDRHKPAPDSLLLAMENLSVSRQEVIYVGDSITDAKTAEAAEVEFVAVLSGTTSPKEFDAFPNMTVLAGVDQEFVRCIVERNPNGTS
jgi:phosphoglycolate phosphatase|tara:strand:- start:190 stop:882 length:693 start_codon:yes stop_codon:yes gene_type:complete